MHARTVLGERKVSILERCPHFRGVLRKEFLHNEKLYDWSEKCVKVDPSFLLQAPLSGSVEPFLVDLIPGGSKIPVTPDRVQEYVRSETSFKPVLKTCNPWFVLLYRLYATFMMYGCVRDELKAMKEGLNDVIPPELLSGLTAEVCVINLSLVVSSFRPCNQIFYKSDCKLRISLSMDFVDFRLFIAVYVVLPSF